MLTAFVSADVIAGIYSYQLRVTVMYSGGCKEHSFSACWDGSFVKTSPPRARIILVHDDNCDVCRKLVTEELQIDLSDLIPANRELFIDVHSINMEPVTAVFPISELREDINEKLEKIDARLTGIDDRIRGIGMSTSDVERPLTGGGANEWTKTSRSPDGYYVVAVTGQDHDGGRFCYDCMSKFRVICRKIQWQTT